MNNISEKAFFPTNLSGEGAPKIVAMDKTQKLLLATLTIILLVLRYVNDTLGKRKVFKSLSSRMIPVPGFLVTNPRASDIHVF